MNIQPLGNQILIEEEEKESSKNGILLPDSVKSHKGRGVAVAVGKGRMQNSGIRYQMSINEGDVCLFDPLDCREVTIEGKDYVILLDEEVWAVLND